MSKEGKDTKLNVIGVLGTLIIIGLWLTAYLTLKDEVETVRGTFGDMFGGVNALFSGFALAGIIFTILLQRKELELQREELKATRLEFNTQNRTLRLQRFENTFFNLLSLHHQIVEGIDADSKIPEAIADEALRDWEGWKYSGSQRFINITLKGRDVFKEKYDLLVKYISQHNTRDLNTAYLEVYEDVQTDFGHYFRNLYRIIKFVNETEFYSSKELEGDITSSAYYKENFRIRYEYTSMVRAQLSDYELLWLFYNCLTENGQGKFKPLVEEYGLLKNLPQHLIHDPRLLDEYEDKAFESRL